MPRALMHRLLFALLKFGFALLVDALAIAMAVAAFADVTMRQRFFPALIPVVFVLAALRVSAAAWMEVRRALYQTQSWRRSRSVLAQKFFAIRAMRFVFLCLATGGLLLSLFEIPVFFLMCLGTGLAWGDFVVWEQAARKRYLG